MFSLRSLFRAKADPKEALRPLYHAIVQTAREPHWYVEGQVPDTLDGRFDMISLIFALVTHRLDQDGQHDVEGVLLTEVLVEDMDGQLRQIGFGDMVVGKQVGRMMAALGGRLGAYKADPHTPDFREGLIRNLWRGTPPADAAIDHVVERSASLQARLATMPIDALVQATQLPGA